MRKIMKAITSTSSIILLSTLLVGCGNGASKATTNSNGPIKLTFLQSKREIVSDYNKYISEFEKQNPNIQITQIQPPNYDTVLQADISKGQLPDLVADAAETPLMAMMNKGIFLSWAGSPLLKDVPSTYVNTLEKYVGKSTPYALPYALNAVPVIYNVDLFNKYHLKVPTTWNEFIAEAKQVKAQGGTPFYNGFKDAWTFQNIWPSLEANNEDPSFLSDLKDGKADFSKLTVAADRTIQLASLGQSSQFGTDYNDANTGFAKGKSVFYLQGTWALPVLRQVNPNIKLGTFVFPASDDPSTTKLVTGVDMLYAIPNTGNTAKENAAKKFVAFLFQKKNASHFANTSGTISIVKGVKTTDPTLAPLQAALDNGQVTDWPTQYYPPTLASNYTNLLQGAVSKHQSAAQMLQQFNTTYQQAYKQHQ